MKYYSQYKEDQYLFEHYNLPRQGFFLDVGASNGFAGSVTKVFENYGWDGICFEPNPVDFAKCKTQRKRVMQIAISNQERPQTFYIHPKIPTHSGLKRNHNLAYREIMVDTKRLDTIIKAENITTIDLLSVDTEGTEIDVLQSYNIRAVPTNIIVVEYISQKIVNPELETFFQLNADLYDLEGQFGANLIFIRKDFREKCGKTR